MNPVLGMQVGRGWFSPTVFHPNGDIVAYGEASNKIGFYDITGGRPQKTIEGHTDIIRCLAFSGDGVVLGSKSDDCTTCLWDVRTAARLARIDEEGPNVWHFGLAFHPGRPWFAATGNDGAEDVIRIWQYDYAALLATPADKAVSYKTAKIVLVGDSGVGKTGLGWRLSHGTFKAHSSTHGQQFWLLKELSSTRADGTRCEAVLWDLAGQADYRMTHALFLDDADIALILFDAADARDPLRGVEFWLKQLAIGRQREEGSNPPAAVLVPARSDRGTTLMQSELDGFCRAHDVSCHVTTSAMVGTGIDQLLQRINELLRWDDKPATVTTETFKRIKDYVLGRKESEQDSTVILSFEALRALLKAHRPGWTFTDAEMSTAVQHLQTHGYVKILRTSRGDKRVLLKPELLNNLASSFVIEARSNPQGLGTLRENMLFDGGYRLPEISGMPKDLRDILIDATVSLFLEHNVCFRESDPLSLDSYLVFPELINLKKPASAEDIAVEDAASYSVTGATENVYAALVVLLGYTRGFARVDQWHDQARYLLHGRFACGFKVDASIDGQLHFLLYYGTDVGEPVRMLFQGMFENILARRGLDVVRYRRTICDACGSPLHRALVRAKLDNGATFLFCNDCGAKVPLRKPDKVQLAQQLPDEVDVLTRAAAQRTPFEQAAFRIRSFVKSKGHPAPRCFISYARGNAEHERWVERNLAADIKKAGVDVLLDKWDNASTGQSISRFIEKIEDSKWVVVVGTPLYLQKHRNSDPERGKIVAAETDLISVRLTGTEARKATVLPVLLEGDPSDSLPPMLRGRVYADFRDPESYFLSAFDLILDLYSIPRTDPAVADLRDLLQGLETEIV
jgi:GTPase SAR1 family protein